MGKTKTAFIGETLTEDSTLSGRAKWEKKKAAKEAKEKNEVKVPGLKGGERVKIIGADDLPVEEAPGEEVKETKQGAQTKESGQRGKKYLEKLASIEANKKYSLSEAVETVKSVSTSKFDGNVELHMSLAKKGRFEVALPHTGSLASKRVEVTSDETIAKLEKGQVDFDVLIATPDFMPRLVPFAKLLGPRGLMPNPKAGTITTDPKSAVEKFSGGTLILQTEKDFPLIHTVVGKVSDEPKSLTENTQAIFMVIGIQNIKSVYLAPTMGPSVKVAVA